ncbi:MAG TPA: hypothetical protein VHF23_07765 [Gaiellaceae bacterium]|nr:hypothetical protein [Gaiellaceae bacterium]
MSFAAIRPDDVNFPLLLHVLGAMVLVGMLFVAALALLVAWRRADGSTGLTRFGFWSILAGVLPGYVLMRIGAEWTASEEFGGSDPRLAWLDIGYITADVGALIIILSIVLSIVGLRRTRADAPGGSTLARIVGVAAVLLLAAYLVAVWAMTSKPS